VFNYIGKTFGVRTVFFNYVLYHSIDLCLWNEQRTNAELIYFPCENGSNKSDEVGGNGVAGDKCEDDIHNVSYAE